MKWDRNETWAVGIVIILLTITTLIFLFMIFIARKVIYPTPSFNQSLIHSFIQSISWFIYNLSIKPKIDQTDTFIEQIEWCHKPNDSCVSKFHYHMNIVPIITTIGLLTATNIGQYLCGTLRSTRTQVCCLRWAVCPSVRKKQVENRWTALHEKRPCHFRFNFFILEVTDTLHTFPFAFICETPMELDLTSTPCEQ